MELLEQFGPLYPKLGPGVAKYRKIRRNKITREQINAYGDAVHAAIRALQRAELQRELPSIPPRCMSRTWHADADKIHAAIKQQQHRALVCCPDQERRARTPNEWQRLYDEAMQAKRERAAIVREALASRRLPSRRLRKAA